MSDNKHVYVLLDNEPVSIFGIYSTAKNMIYAYNNLSQKEKGKLKEFRIISLDINKNQKEIKRVNAQDYFIIRAGVLNGEKYFPYEIDTRYEDNIEKLDIDLKNGITNVIKT